MAINPSTGTSVSSNSFPAFIQYEPPALVGGLVQHALITASTQVQILRIVDETGSASVADIVAGLPGHPDPVGAIQVMVALKILVLTLSSVSGVLDGNTTVSRADSEPDPLDNAGSPRPLFDTGGAALWPDIAGGRSVVPVPTDCAIPAGLERLRTSPFLATVVIGSGASRRDFSRAAELRCPGIYALLNSTQVYIGTGADVGLRVALGQQRIANIETVVVITDANLALSDDDARAAERMFWARVSTDSSRALVNDLPDGARIDAQRYSEIDAFLGQACLALHHNGVLFGAQSARSVLSGPRQEPRRLAPRQLFSAPPSGDILELHFGSGMVALAARQETRWVLLQGSDVRIETVPSANTSTRFLRAAWLHAGLLNVSPDGRSYVTTRDLVFRSGSGMAQFCTGSKGRTLECWKPADTTAVYHTEPAAMIAA